MINLSNNAEIVSEFGGHIIQYFGKLYHAKSWSYKTGTFDLRILGTEDIKRRSFESVNKNGRPPSLWLHVCK